MPLKFSLFSQDSAGYSSASDHPRPTLIPRHSVWDFWSTKLHWDRFFSEHFNFVPISIIPKLFCNPVSFICHRNVWKWQCNSRNSYQNVLKLHFV